MRLLGLLLCLGFGDNLAAATELPSITPQVSSLFPHGARRGSEVQVEFRGSYLDRVSEIRFLDPQLSAKIESVAFRSVRARIRVDAAAEPGKHEFQLISARGAWFGLFWVGTLDEQLEAEPNDTQQQAKQLSLPAAIHGRADGADPDYYRFHAEAGQTVVADVLSTRLGSSLDPVLSLFDSNGRELAYNDDAYAFKDARLAYTFARAGDYAILVSSSFERSARDAEYRLLLTNGSCAVSSLPLGARRGTTAELLIRGWNLDKAAEVSLGENGRAAEILSRQPGELRVRLVVPGDAQPGLRLLHVAGGCAPLRFEVSDSPEITLTSRRQTIPRDGGLIVNGHIAASANRLERIQEIEFEAKAGERLEFAVAAWKLGELMDPVLTLFDAAGRELIQEDDPAPNSFIHHPATHDPRLVYAFAAGGKYRLRIHDAAYQAGGSYRLSIRKVRPDFEAEVRTPQLTIHAGRTGKLLAVIRRTGGVHVVEPFRKSDNEIEHFRLIEKDGWNTPIHVRVEGLPEGLRADTATAEPRNTFFKGNDGEELFVDGTVVEVPITVPANARAGLYEVRVRASGQFEGRSVERLATVLSGTMRAYRGEPAADQRLLLNIVEAPPVLWNAPAEIRISKGQPDRLKIGLVRMEGTFPVDVAAKRGPVGWTVGQASAGANVEEVEVPVTAGPDAANHGELVLVATFERGGRREHVESPPIELRIKP